MPLPSLPPSNPSFFGFSTVKDDWQVMDSLMSIWYFIRYQEAVPIANPVNAIPIPNVLGRARGMVLSDYLQTDEKTFHVWVDEMPAQTGPLGPDGVTPLWSSPFTPAVGDIIVEQNGWMWLVERVDFQTFVSRYRLACRKFVVP